MSRTAAAEVIEVKPQSNVYTALAAVATAAVLVAFLILYSKAAEIFVEGHTLFGS